MDKFSTDLEGYDYELSYEQDPNKPVPVEVSELGKFIETRGLEMVKIYEQTGRRKEADELKEKLKKALTAKKQLEKISQLDFNRPKKVIYYCNYRSYRRLHRSLALICMIPLCRMNSRRFNNRTQRTLECGCSRTNGTIQLWRKQAKLQFLQQI